MLVSVQSSEAMLRLRNSEGACERVTASTSKARIEAGFDVGNEQMGRTESVWHKLSKRQQPSLGQLQGHPTATPTVPNDV